MEKTHKPATVETVQVLFVGVAIVALVGFCFLCFSFLRGAQFPLASESAALFAAFFIPPLLSLLAAWAMQRRKQYGRWLAVFILSIGLAVWIFVQCGSLFIWPTPAAEAPTLTKQVVNVTGLIVTSGIWLTFTLALAFAKDVSEFFRGAPNSASS